MTESWPVPACGNPAADATCCVGRSRALNGTNEPVKEHEIGLAVFDKPESWDPRLDPIVRVEFNRLRQKLREFYAAEGLRDPILIDFPAREAMSRFQ